MRPTVLIVDDHDWMRQALRDWIGAKFPEVVVDEVATGEAAVEVARAKRPQVVLMDIGLPGLNGLDATRRVKLLVPTTKVVMVSVHDTAVHRAAASAAGAIAYVPKCKFATELEPLLRAIMESEGVRNA